jgi:cytochrome c oxidase subunit II
MIRATVQPTVQRPGRALLTAVPLAGALFGCGGPQDFMRAAGGSARAIANFGWMVLLVFTAVAILVWLLLLWVSSRRRGTFADRPKVDAAENRRWITIGGMGIPAAVFFALFVMMFRPMQASPVHDETQRTPADMLITGRQWWFDAEYFGDTPNSSVHVPTEIHIPVGRAVNINLETRDVIHSFWVPKLQGKVDLVPGITNRIQLEADKPGEYAGECAEFCGVQHAHMRILVVAQPEAEYETWLASQRNTAASSQGRPDATYGAQVFQASACPLCHTVRGTDAHGLVGPDLTHVGSRKTIAGGMLVNDTANLEAWITDAQALKPGTQMPTLHQFDGRDVRAMVAYLQSLQ